MIGIFVPDRVINHFSELSVEDLKKQNIKLFLCDIDNTLVGPDDAHPSKEAKDYLKKISDSGIQVVLISNNTTQRVELFNEDLNYPAYPMALKPLTKTYNQIKKDFPNIEAHEILSLGDQVMTDVIGSNLAKINVVLTKQIVSNDLLVTKANRIVEHIVIKFLKYRKKWPNDQM